MSTMKRASHTGNDVVCHFLNSSSLACDAGVVEVASQGPVHLASLHTGLSIPRRILDLGDAGRDAQTTLLRTVDVGSPH